MLLAAKMSREAVAMDAHLLEKELSTLILSVIT
jgi:hypothetical protein